MFMPFFCPASGAVFSAMSFVDSSNSSASTITIPSTAQIGDVGILFQRADGSTVTEVVPSGWTSIANGTGGSSSNKVRNTICFKILVSGDPGATITGMNASNNTKTLVVLRPDVAINGYSTGPTVPAGDTGSLATGDYTQQSTGGNPPSMTCTASNSGNPVTLVIGATGSDDGTCSPSGTLVSTAVTNYATSVRQAAYIAIYNGPASDLVYDEVDTGTLTVAQAVWLGFF